MFTIQKLRDFVHKMYLCVSYQCHKKSVIFLHRWCVLGEFAGQLRKANTTFDTPVRPTANSHGEKLGFNRKGFREIKYLNIFFSESCRENSS